jgi:hypothetical protein
MRGAPGLAVFETWGRMVQSITILTVGQLVAFGLSGGVLFLKPGSHAPN